MIESTMSLSEQFGLFVLIDDEDMFLYRKRYQDQEFMCEYQDL